MASKRVCSLKRLFFLMSIETFGDFQVFFQKPLQERTSQISEQAIRPCCSGSRCAAFYWRVSSLSPGHELSMTNLIQKNQNECNEANYDLGNKLCQMNHTATFYLLPNCCEPQSFTQLFHKFGLLLQSIQVVLCFCGRSAMMRTHKWMWRTKNLKNI